jgi:hypothetical protein
MADTLRFIRGAEGGWGALNQLLKKDFGAVNYMTTYIGMT